MWKALRNPAYRSYRRLAVAGLLLFPFVGIAVVYIGNRFILRQARPFVFESSDDAPPRYTAIVLGAKVWGTEPSPILEDRLQTGLALYRARKVKRILVSGDHGSEAYDEVNAMRAWLLERGVAEADVFMDHAGFRTNDTMQRARRVFEVKDAIVVTQRFHLSRAVYLAHLAGIDAVGVVADRRRYQGERYNSFREAIARTSAFLEATVLGTEPRFLGESIPITGDAGKTVD